MNFVAFASWSEVLAYAASGEPLYYHAPLDIEPVRIRPFTYGIAPWYRVTPRTIQITPVGALGRGKNRTADPFTADRWHLDRFKRPIELHKAVSP